MSFSAIKIEVTIFEIFQDWTLAQSTPLYSTTANVGWRSLAGRHDGAVVPETKLRGSESGREQDF